MAESTQSRPAIPGIGDSSQDTASVSKRSDWSSRRQTAEKPGMTVPQALDKAGGFGKYHCLLLLTMILANNGPGLVVYGVAYYEIEPPYLCTYTVPQYVSHTPDTEIVDEKAMMAGHQFLYTVSCNSTTVCATGSDQDPTLVSYKANTADEFYISNWVEQLNMQCLEATYVGLIGALAFLGAALSCFFIPQLGDKYGRYTIWSTTIFLQLPLYLMANLTHNIGMVYIACFYLGMGLIGRFACGFVLLTESLPKKNQAIMGTASMVGDVVATMYITFYLRYINNNANDLVWIGFALNIASIILAFFLVESPSWLVSAGRKEEAKKALMYIAKMNGAEDFHVDELREEKFETGDAEAAQKKNEDEPPSFGNNVVKDISVEQEEGDKKGLLTAGEEGLDVGLVQDGEKEKEQPGFCQDKNLLCNLILMAIFWTSSSFNYYIMTFYLKYIPGNVYVNTSLSCTSEIIAYIGSGLVMDTFGVKLSFIISFILAAAGGIFLVIFFDAEGALIATFVLFAKFGISFAFNISYLSTPQMFPVALCTTAFGICNIFARFSTVLSPLIAELPDPAPMSIFSIMCIASAFLPLFLRPVKKSD